MTWENNKSKGITINNKEVILSQFADDTPLCLDGSEESFKDSIRILRDFALISGLKRNNEKHRLYGLAVIRIQRCDFLGTWIFAEILEFSEYLVLFNGHWKNYHN